METRTILFENTRTALELTLENGRLYTDALVDKATGYRFGNPDRRQPLFHIPGFDTIGAAVTVTEDTDTRGGLSAAAKVMRLLFAKEGRKVQLELRTYPDNPFIRVSLSLEGHFGLSLEAAEAAGESGIETAKRGKAPEIDVLFRCPIAERHWKVRTVVLRDITDANNILVEESSTTVYTRRPYEGKGQFFFLDAYVAREMLLFAKEAPCFAGRVADSAYDLRIEPDGQLLVAGLGVDLTCEADYTFDTPLFAVSVGVGETQDGLERSWRDYYRLDMAGTLRRGLVSMSNTWGDRNQDAAVCEAFMLGEIERAKRLGCMAVQIDDGWQKGISANSKLAKGTLWGTGYYASDPDYWTPHPTKFPRGLTPVAEAAKEAGIALGLWFSPDQARHYESWQRDAETLLGLYETYGVTFFKLDGITLSDKLLETRLAAMVRMVHEKSGGKVSFNFDITAQRRWGYLTMREYGNLFVENRYTDFASYYPHSTLRTMWMLSRYVPTAKLQMEFLNLRRCPEKYGNDPFAPGLYPMDWAYAAVMFACPLYWMEMTHLAEEDGAVLAEIAKIRNDIATDLAQADVTPVGEEPDGLTFTGLRADCGAFGYLLLFRENSEENAYDFHIPALSGKKLTRLAGTAEVTVLGDKVVFTSATVRTFGLYRYE